MSLSPMQKRYIWLAGSFPSRIVVQGRGYRTRQTMYSLVNEDEIVIFGYSNPPMWLVNRDLFRPLQARNSYTLTGAGEMIFEQLLASGAGGKINEEIREVRHELS